MDKNINNLISIILYFYVIPPLYINVNQVQNIEIVTFVTINSEKSIFETFCRFFNNNKKKIIKPNYTIWMEFFLNVMPV